jgi:DNA-binding NarL/FixJ family response regulator
MIRVLIEASAAVSRAGLEALLRAHPSIEVVEPISGADAVDVETAEHPADIVLAEFEDRDGDFERDIINRASSGISMIVLAHQTTAEWVMSMLRDGVKAILPANATGPEIIATIEAVYAGLIVLIPSDLDSLVSSQNRLSDSTPSVLEPLTSRETEVLQLLALGLANKEIAGRLQISEHTVKFHVASILGKLGASSRTEAVTLGIRHGMVMI